MTVVPKQILLGKAAILTEGVTVVFITLIAIILEFTTVIIAHVAFDVITTLTISPFAKDVVVYVAEFVPTLPPFNCH